MSTIIKNTKNTISLVDADGNECRVRVFGNASDPHFCGKHICQILDIKDFKQAIQDMVNEPHKKELKILLEEQNNGLIVPNEVGVLKPPTSLGSINLQHLSHNDRRLAVLPEPGV